MTKEYDAGFFFMIKEWLSDPQLKMACFTVKGMWIDMLCYMWRAPERGKLLGTKESLCQLLGCSGIEMDLFLMEAKEFGFCDVTEDVMQDVTLHVMDCNKKIQICNRRICNEEKAKEANRLRVRLHRERKARNADVQDIPNPTQPNLLKEPPKNGGHFEQKIKDVDILGLILKRAEMVVGLRSKPKFDPKKDTYKFIQKWTNENNHPRSILDVLDGFIIYWETIKNPAAYASKILKRVTQNYNEAEHVKQVQEFKVKIGPELKKLLKGIG